ncbi:MAG: hypothetical protein Q9166_004304 [cf. Caloplaca sp. 2 TL-2023]
MDFTQSTIATTTSYPDPRTAWRDTNPPTVHDGQNHDRMETDEEEHDSSSEDDISSHNQHIDDPAVLDFTHQTHSGQEEAMDTTPDDPRLDERSGHLLGPDSQASSSSDEDDGPPPNASTINQPEASINTSRPHSPAGNGALSPPETPPSPPPATSEAVFAVATDPLQIDTQAGDGDATLPENATTPPAIAEGGTLPPQGANNDQGDIERQEGREVDESRDDDSSDEEERAYWADFVEDTTAPDEAELRIIEEDGHEKDALKHDHWESIVFEPLEDPEYVPGASGRVHWTVTPVNGTPDKPNRDKIMRSPSVLIGGLYWNIKYFPRGNDGTEHMSVYVECSSSPDGPESDDESDIESSSTKENEATSSGEAPAGEDVHHSHTISPDVNTSPEVDLQAAEVTKGPSENRAKEGIPWETAAQVGCVVYNPNEPRVNKFRNSCHRFTNDNSDWGWTRFHGPWETIHLRQRLNRQALLRNDTLAFTAYIRTVKDDTKALWWHAPKKGRDWDSFDRIGVKSLATASSRDSVIVAAISCWLHLNPIVEMIKNMRIPDASAHPQERKRPLFAALQQVLDYMAMTTKDSDQQPMINLTSWLDWYITDTHMSRSDLYVPIVVWESVRRILNFEASGTSDMAAASDLFHDILLLKQPDPWKDELPVTSSTTERKSDSPKVSKPDEPCSVQETVDLASSSINPFRVWSGSDGPSLEQHDQPLVLQVELHRHRYDSKARKWNKLTHHIELNETITYTMPKAGTKCDYTLFGFIVETGSLASQDCYSVIRPSGPGTRWIKYSGNTSHRGASCLTTNQAITAHEGKGTDTTGHAAVAHVVLYVRTDKLPSILSPSNSPSESSSVVSKPNVLPQETDGERKMPLRIYSSSLFNSHNGRGLPDLWAPVSQDDASPIIDLRIPGASSIAQTIEQLDEGFLKVNKDEASDEQYTCGLWYLESDLSSVRGLPRMLPVSPEDTLEKVTSRHDVCRIWLHMEKSDGPKQNRDITVVQDGQSTETQQAEEAAQGTVDQSEDIIMTQDPPTQGLNHTGEPEVDNQTQDAPASPPGAPSSPPSGPQATPENEVPAPPQQVENEGIVNPEDATMSEAQDPPATADAELSTTAAPPKPLIYFFVKTFDVKTQELRGVGSKLVPLESDIHTEVGRILGTEDAMELYLEKARVMWEDDQVRPSRSFADYELRDGCILIAHRRPSAEEATSLVTQGKHTNPITYFQHLRYNEPYRAYHEVKSEYGTEYHSLPRSYGLIHGSGTKIYSNGDAYVGNWVSNEKCGHGTMAYSSGNTYEGNWEHDEPDGEGKMVYGITQNVYVGGWKKGRRHGKGVMHFEVADEEQAMCKICYESEMDALFYDCGHVVACEECARQVDVCPVCRKNVRAVCRIWKTL